MLLTLIKLVIWIIDGPCFCWSIQPTLNSILIGIFFLFLLSLRQFIVPIILIMFLIYSLRLISFIFLIIGTRWVFRDIILGFCPWIWLNVIMGVEWFMIDLFIRISLQLLHVYLIFGGFIDVIRFKLLFLQIIVFVQIHNIVSGVTSLNFLCLLVIPIHKLDLFEFSLSFGIPRIIFLHESTLNLMTSGLWLLGYIWLPRLIVFWFLGKLPIDPNSHIFHKHALRIIIVNHIGNNAG